MTITEQHEQLLTRAVEAVRDWYGRDRGEPADATWQAERRTQQAVSTAVARGHRAAQIAAAAGVRQLLVAKLIDTPRERAEALVAARHDAERYEQQVIDALRTEARRRWQHDTRDGRKPAYGTKLRIARELGVTRKTLDAWINDEEIEKNHEH